MIEGQLISSIEALLVKTAKIRKSLFNFTNYLWTDSVNSEQEGATVITQDFQKLTIWGIGLFKIKEVNTSVQFVSKKFAITLWINIKEIMN